MSQTFEYGRYTEERGEHIEREVEIYESADAVKGHNPKPEKEDTNKETQHPGEDQKVSRGCILTVLGVVLLGVLLLTAITVLLIEFNNLTRKNNLLLTTNNNLTTERDQLQTRFNNLTTERDQLQTSFNNLTTEREQLQTSYNNLTTERDQLQTSYNNLTTERDQLQTRYNNLTTERDQLQTRYNNLTMERDQLQKEMDAFLKINFDLCKCRWIIFSSSFYYVSNESKSWEESRQNCRDKGADLMVINSREEQEFISKHISSISGVWIGMSDREKEGEWKWVDGSPLTVKYWGPYEPNGKENENCGEIYKSSTMNLWNDNSCSKQQQWVCKKKILPEVN